MWMVCTVSHGQEHEKKLDVIRQETETINEDYFCGCCNGVMHSEE